MICPALADMIFQLACRAEYDDSITECGSSVVIGRYDYRIAVWPAGINIIGRTDPCDPQHSDVEELDIWANPAQEGAIRVALR
ncbi:hypothetical protein ACIPXV_23025 [Streptomyces libani]|uniref:hypothetical protein n=1 Tax=Streptomyces nigrescens TaxID=1920 RepID=UPI003817BAE1